MAYTTATQAASVAVKNPPKMPPTMITNIRIAHMDSTKALTRALNGAFSPAG
jgi:hypothetical protein